MRLTDTEHLAFQYLAHRPGQLVSSQVLNDELFGGRATMAAVRMLVVRLREKLGPRVIDTVRGVGYRVRPSGAARWCRRCEGIMVDYPDVRVCYACGAQLEQLPAVELAVDLEVGRADRPGERSGTAWTDEDRARLREMWTGPYSQAEIGETLQRSASSVRAEAAALGLGRKPYVRSTPS